MALSNLLNDRLREASLPITEGGDPPPESPGEFIEKIIVDLLKDEAVRAEVWQESRYAMVAEGVSVADIHAVLDGLIRVFQDEAVDPVETVVATE